MAFEIVAENSAYCCRNTCHQQLMREQTVSRFYIRLKVTFSNSIYLELTRKEGNSSAVLISAVFRTRQHVHSQMVFWSKFFKTFK